jgi:hypothetical protein
MTTAYLKTRELQMRLNNRGIDATFEQAEILRRAELTLQSWSELECGNSDQWKSYGIERDEKTDKPYMVTHMNDGRTFRRPVPDREKGALKRIAETCKVLGIYFFHQTDPRGCALYVHTEPLPDNNYTQGIACCN